MCGITGYISATGNQYRIEDKLDIISHRGPNGRGVYYDNRSSLSVGLGHVRLSIIDVSASANQPFISSCERYVLVYNGEIYNYKALKNKYFKGKEFRTNSDTEVLLNIYIKYGVSKFSELKGMFAFAIFDKKEQKLVCARDPLGIKPLYFHANGKDFIFGSELKSVFLYEGVKREVDTTLLPEFLLNSFLYEPDTGFKNLSKIEPGSYIEIQANEKNDGLDIKKVKYWSIGDASSQAPKNQDIGDLLKSSIKNHLVSDVPVGLFFSGGVDSSIILREVKDRVKPLIIKADEDKYKEAGITSDFYYAKKISKLWNTELEEIELGNKIKTNNDFFDSIIEVAQQSEEPIADFTFISSRLLSKVAKEKGYTVMLSGMGADELFAGYPRYNLVNYSKIYGFLTPFANLFLKNNPSFSKKIERFNTFFSEDSFVMKYTSLIGYFSRQELSNNTYFDFSLDGYQKKLEGIIDKSKAKTDLKKAMALDLYGFLSHNFLVADKSSMLEGIEMRVPLATKELAEYAFQLKDSDLSRLGKDKRVLKNYLRNYLSNDIVNRKKAGFNPPLDGFIKKVPPSELLAFMSDHNLFDLLKREYVEELVNEHFTTSKNNTFKIYLLLYLSAWYHTWKN